MNILLISPLGYAVNPQTKYAGIEKLAYQYACELAKEHKVTVLGHSDSELPSSITNMGTKPKIGEDIFTFAELRQYQAHQYLLRTFDVIHDFSHQHFACRYNANLPALNLFWHSPAIAQYPKAPYNIIAPSEWAARQFQKYYQQEARYQQSIVIDPEEYKPSGGRGDRFFTLGIMAPDKGNLAVIMMCKELGVPLDVAGRGADEKDKDYERTCLSLCDGELIKFHGEVSDEKKIELMQTCRALIYVLPNAYAEVTSHKVQEAMFCGAPIITSKAGALPEIITDGVDGFLCSTDNEFREAIKNVDKLKPEVTHEQVVEKYSIGGVVRDYIKLYEEVAGGLRW